MKNIAQFFLEWLGKENDNGSYKGECVNLIHSYYEEVLGLTRFVGNAKDYLKETRIPKVFGQIMPSDIVVFNYGDVGHIGVCVWSRAVDFECMEQNNPIGSPCHYVYHQNSTNVIGILRPTLHENTVPRPNHVPEVGKKFTMSYTAINSDPSLLEQARQILLKDSNGRIDCSFQYQQLPPIVSPTLWTSDEQTLFLKNFPVSTPFCYISYQGYDPNHFDARTSTVAGSKVYLTASYNVTDPVAVAFEMLHGLQEYILDKGFPIGLPLDNYNATPELVQAKVDLCVSFLDNLV